MFASGVNLKKDRIAQAFLCTIANTSYDTWTPAVIDYHCKREVESDAYIEKLLSEQAAERSKRARNAALAGAAKRRKRLRRPTVRSGRH